MDKLHVYGPFHWIGEPNVFTSEFADGEGMYLWSVKTQDGDLVSYVGESVRLGERMKEHMREYLSGWYRVYEPDSFQNGEKNLIWNGMWRRGDELNAEDFISRSDEFIPAIHTMLRTMRLWLIPTNYEVRIRRRIEGEIAKQLNSREGIVGEFQEKDIRYEYRGDNEEPVEVILKSDGDILGLPKQLKA